MAEIDSLPYHRKYRSESFAEYIGNAKLKEAVMSTLAGGNRPQVIMLHGNSGCGKTTMARLIAKEYNCMNRGESGACGVCESCLAMNEYIKTGQTGVLANVHEVNIAERRGVHDIDEIFEDMGIPVYGDEWKVYIFDECHRATDALQNRFLKIVEEPPDNVLFIFCTTNPEEMLETLKNRCQMQLKVTKPTVRELSGLLRKVCMAEQVDYDRPGLEFIANRSGLTIRTALQNLWQVVQSKGSAKYEVVESVFDGVAGSLLADLFRALKSGNVMRYVTLICEAKSRMEMDAFLSELKEFLVRGIYIINGVTVEGVTAGEMAVYRDLFLDVGVVQMSGFMDRLLGIDMGSVELELLALGYQGLRGRDTKVAVSGVVQVDNELAEESANAVKEIIGRDEAAYEAGVANADKAAGGCGLDLLLSMGGVLVEG